MNELTVAWLWSVGQVSLLLGLGLVGARWFLPRSPRLGLVLMNGVTLLALLATCLAVLPLASQQPSRHSLALPTRHHQTDQVGTEIQPGVTAFRWSLDLQSLRNRTAALSDGVPLSTRAANICTTWFLGLATLTACVALARLVSACWFVQRLARGSTLIREATVHQQVVELAQQMSFAPSVTLRESSRINSAAALGWWRPTIVLPMDWREWSSVELAAVLAHEIAHLKQRDCHWRILSAVLQTLHAYHPLVYPLTRRLVLLQELAADRRAARALGSQRIYLRALAQLALRRDKHSRDATKWLLPVFSGYLIRRIKMLKNQDDSRGRLYLRVAYGTTLGVLLLVGVSCLGLRVLAQAPKEEPAARVARSASARGEQRDESRPPTEISLVGNNEYGMCVIRVDQIMRQPELAKMMELALGEMLPSDEDDQLAWKEVTGSDQMPKFSFSNIEYIACRPTFSVRNRNDAEPEGQQGRVTFGASLLVIQFKNDAPLDEWIGEYTPLAKKLKHEGLTYYQLPTFPLFGPMPISFAKVPNEPRKIVFGIADSETKQPKILLDYLQKKKPGPPARWTKDWDSVSGGTFSLICSDKEVEVLKNDGTPITVSRNKCLEHGRTFGLRIKLPLDSDRFSARLHVGCDNLEAAERVKEGLKERLADVRKLVQEEFASGPDATVGDDESKVAEGIRSVVDNATLRVSSTEDGRANVTLEFETTMTNKAAVYALQIFVML